MAMEYHFNYNTPHKRLLEIEFNSKINPAEQTIVELPAWRPGRYELGNFAKNLVTWNVFDETGKKLEFKKTAKDTWQINTKGVKHLLIKYSYFTTELNAGSCWIDNTQLYINPIHCCVYIKEFIDAPCKIKLNIPQDFKVATALKKKDEFFETTNYHHLVDSPLIASSQIHHNFFILDGIEINLWLCGDVAPQWGKIVNDFFIFVNEHLLMFNGFIRDEFHFLFQILPFKFYHGVEHAESTVIALGPGNKIFEKELYQELLGVSCHEFFHCWNVKTIRPSEMFPYDYKKENYSRLGYVYEGVTTYYGDYLLFRSGVFSFDEYANCFNVLLNKHFDNFGRLNLSVADSSFDTWLDGYAPGVPNRKTNIYTEGALCALMLDVLIRQHSNNIKSLDDLMRSLYFDFAKKNKPYNKNDYKTLAIDLAGEGAIKLFDNHIYGTGDYLPLLSKCLFYLGLEIKKIAKSNPLECFFGLKTQDSEEFSLVKSVYPGSMADLKGISIGDHIISINGFKSFQKLDFSNPNLHSNKLEIELLGFRSSYFVTLEIPNENQYFDYQVVKVENPTNLQLEQFKVWAKRDW